MEPITLKRREGESFTTKVIAVSDIAINITTCLAGKRPKTECEGLATLKVPVETRVSEIVNTLLGQGYFSDILEGAQQELEFFSAVFRDWQSLNSFLQKAREAGVLTGERTGSSVRNLDFNVFSAVCKNTIQGVQISAYVQQGLRHVSVPVFYAMKDYTIELDATGVEGQALDLCETFMVEQRAGRLGPSMVTLLESVGAILKPLSSSSIGRGRGTRFSVSL